MNSYEELTKSEFLGKVRTALGEISATEYKKIFEEYASKLYELSTNSNDDTDNE